MLYFVGYDMTVSQHSSNELSVPLSVK